MIECSICCCSTSQSEIISLTCCNNQICNTCIESLVVPLCPYCRSVIKEIQDKDIYKQGYSYNDTLSSYTISQLSTPSPPLLRPIDDTQIISRIIRRKIRRLRKLRERESKSRQREDIQRHIQEELDIFYFNM